MAQEANFLHVATQANEPPEKRLALWQDVMRLSGTIQVPEPATFQGSFATRAVGNLRTMRIAASTFRLTRDRDHSVRVPRDYLLVNLVESGTFRGRLAGRKLVAEHGDLVLSRHTDRMDVWLEEATWLALLLPIDLVDRHMRWPARLNGSVHSAGSVPAAMLGGLTSAMWGLRNGLTPPEIASATATSLATLASCLRLPAPPPLPDQKDKERLAQTIRRFIADRLADPALDAEMLARSFNLSRSALYRIMSTTGDIATIIRRLRMHAIRRDILATRAERPPLAELARRWGIMDERTFRRAFTREFGSSPSALRESGTNAASSEPVEGDLYRWFIGL